MKKIGYIGLGKMGMGQVERLLERGYEVFAWNRSEKPREKAARAGARIFESYEKLCKGLLAPRTIWLMLPSSVVDEALAEISPHLEKGDTVIDGGNSFYKDSMRRAYELAARGVHFLDVGTSGGPSGARNGACLMIGGDREVFQKHEKLFKDLATSYSPFSKGSGRRPRDFEILRLADSPPPLRKEESIQYSYAYVGKAGAGHFVKMVHNGIEYGMMQAIGEGFNLLRSADGGRYKDTQTDADGGEVGFGFGLDLKEIARLYNQGSVIESRLVGWLAKAYAEHGEELSDISGEVSHSGEGQWTVEVAKELKVPVAVIEKSLEFRLESKGNPSYTGQVVSALRNQFGGHEVSSKLKVKSQHS